MGNNILKNLPSINNSGANEDAEEEGKDDGNNGDTFTLRTTVNEHDGDILLVGQQQCQQ